MMLVVLKTYHSHSYVKKCSQNFDPFDALIKHEIIQQTEYYHPCL